MRRLAAAAVLAISTAAFAGAPGSLAGAWLFGDDGPEPKAAVVSIPQRCWNGGVDFTLSETGKKLTGKARWIAPVGGVPRPPRDETETLTGSRDGNHVVLTGQHRLVTAGDPLPVVEGQPEHSTTTVRYDLRLDGRTGHLVGTRDGRPFWLARFRTHHADCGSPPP